MNKTYFNNNCRAVAEPTIPPPTTTTSKQCSLTYECAKRNRKNRFNSKKNLS